MTSNVTIKPVKQTGNLYNYVMCNFSSHLYVNVIEKKFIFLTITPL